MLRSEQVSLLIREGEGLAVEFKEKYASDIDRDIVAFANSKGGTLLLGVRDDGTTNGERLTNDLKGRLNSLARNCKPSLSVEAYQAGAVVVIEVPEGAQKPYGCGTGYFRRLNGSTQKMNHDELRVMFRENDPTPFEMTSVTDFPHDAISRAKITAFVKEAGISIPRVAASDFLRSLKAADDAGVNNAGILFFARDVHRYMPQAQMTLVAFKGREKLHIYDRRDVRDDLLTQFNEAVLFLQKHLNVRSEIRGVNREDILEIPLEAIREAVVNALMHRDYAVTGSQISVEVFDDRVEIVNPGGLPAGLPRKAFGSISVRRNDLIADLFFRLHKVERVGMGIQAMKTAMAAAGLREPMFETNGFFKAVFCRPVKEVSAGASESRGSQKGSQKSSQKILGLAREHPDITIGRLAAALNISERAVKKHLRALKTKGLLKRVGPDKGGHWEVTGKLRGMR